MSPTEPTDNGPPTRAHAPWEFPPEPPAEVLETLATAQRALAELGARELRFGVSERGGKVRVAVVTSEGAVRREIPARDAVEILSSAQLPDLGFEPVG